MDVQRATHSGVLSTAQRRSEGFAQGTPAAAKQRAHQHVAVSAFYTFPGACQGPPTVGEEKMKCVHIEKVLSSQPVSIYGFGWSLNRQSARHFPFFPRSGHGVMHEERSVALRRADGASCSNKRTGGQHAVWFGIGRYQGAILQRPYAAKSQAPSYRKRRIIWTYVQGHSILRVNYTLSYVCIHVWRKSRRDRLISTTRGAGPSWSV